ncbi:hypothetical protein [Alteromonas sp. KUL150]|uniref:hypothetical protein n=1 Tax=Alteromonas sp. KUL150 TaxID=2480805 RepID=UPI00132FA9E9|nr:hypothetical protein [Alteromonas sp. KUL150]
MHASVETDRSFPRYGKWTASAAVPSSNMYTSLVPKGDHQKPAAERSLCTSNEPSAYSIVNSRNKR